MQNAIALTRRAAHLIVLSCAGVLPILVGCSAAKPPAPRFFPPDAPQLIYLGRLEEAPLAQRSADSALSRLFAGDFRDVPLLRPIALAAYVNRVAVADPSLGAVVLYDFAARKTRWHQGVGRASAVAFDPQGNLFVAAIGADRIRSFDASGRERTAVRLPQPGDAPTGLAFSESQLTIALGSPRGGLWRSDRPHATWTPLHPGGVARRTMPAGLDWINDRLLVADALTGKIDEYPPDGSAPRRFSAAPLVRPRQIASAPSGRLLVVDAARHALVLLSPDGREAARAAGSPMLSVPTGVCVSEELREAFALSAGWRSEAIVLVANQSPPAGIAVFSLVGR